MAWECPIFSISLIKQIMPRNRFERIMRAWHYLDASNMTTAELHRRNSENPFWTVDELVEKFAAVAMSSYIPYQSLSLDEQTIPCKCRHRCKCYNPNKPHKWHFKIFSLNCARNGYQWNFYLYRGKGREEDVGRHVTATMYPAVKLLAPPILHNKSYVLYTDNWYTSIPLSLEMQKIGIHTCGTVKSNIKGTSKQHQFAKTGRNRHRGVFK
jgi:hypothetical protein